MIELNSLSPKSQVSTQVTVSRFQLFSSKPRRTRWRECTYFYPSVAPVDLNQIRDVGAGECRYFKHMQINMTCRQVPIGITADLFIIRILWHNSSALTQMKFYLLYFLATARYISKSPNFLHVYRWTFFGGVLGVWRLYFADPYMPIHLM